MTLSKWAGAMALGLTSWAVGATAAGAATLEIVIENTAAPGGLSITPVYLAFHDGNFDAFTVGETASSGLELLAEDGIVSGLPDERLPQSPASVATVAAQPANGPPTIDPGETSTVQIDVDGDLNQFFTFLSMLVPSNDTFLGNGDPMAFELFDDAGVFLGERVIDVTGEFLYDAGTEVNDPLGSPAFVLDPNGNFMASMDENGTVQLATSLADFAGLQTPVGALDGGLIDFTSDRANFSVARITVRDATVAPVPLPAAAWLMLGGLATLGGLRHLRAAA